MQLKDSLGREIRIGDQVAVARKDRFSGRCNIKVGVVIKLCEEFGRSPYITVESDTDGSLQRRAIYRFEHNTISITALTDTRKNNFVPS